jgi:ABC-type uncharacterized transport system ATPase subunit
MCRSAPGHRKGHGSALPCDQCERIREPAMRHVVCCGECLLELDGLTRRYGALTALDNLSFSAPSGQVVGFLVPNGAGKTTTVRAVFGLTELDFGTVRWNGAPVGQNERRRFGYMPEERGLYPAMLVGE